MMLHGAAWLHGPLKAPVSVTYQVITGVPPSATGVIAATTAVAAPRMTSGRTAFLALIRRTLDVGDRDVAHETARTGYLVFAVFPPTLAVPLPLVAVTRRWYLVCRLRWW